MTSDTATPDLTPTSPSDGAVPENNPEKKTNCPDLTGSWAGTLSGSIRSGLTQSPVTGSVWADLRPVPGVASDHQVDKGEMTCQVKNLPSMNTKQNLAGTVHCGVLDIKQQIDMFGVKAEGTVRCTFDANGCNGTWTGNTLDGSTKGSGTFELRRK